MSGISSGVGLVSGLDTAALIEQLIALDSIPIANLQARVTAIDAQRVAFADVAARILSAMNLALPFKEPTFFQRFSATSSNTSVLSASVSEEAVPGSYSFIVHRLAAAHSVISKGFADSGTTPLGIGSISVEVGQGKLNYGTLLDGLNGGAGVDNGSFTITDRAGNSATISLSTAVTMSDVLTAINGAGINVKASVTSVAVDGATGDRLVLEDTTAADEITGDLVVADAAGSTAAADLGIAATSATGRIDGHDLVYMTMDTALSLLNDGNGVGTMFRGNDLHFSTTYGDFDVSLTDLLEPTTSLSIVNNGAGVRLGTIRITDKSGASAEIDLSSALTAQDVINAINDSGVGVSAVIVNAHLQVSDTSGGAGNLKIEDVSGFAAADLGISGDTTASSIAGPDIYRIETIGDVIRAINAAPNNNSFVEAFVSEDGNGIGLRALGFGSTVTVTAGDPASTAAADLGLLDASFDSDNEFRSRHLIAGLNTVLLSTLNGGAGVGSGTVSLTDKSGATTSIDFSAANTLQDVIDLINADPNVALSASIDSAGTGIQIVDESGGTNPLIIEDVDGTVAADLGISVPYDAVNPFLDTVVSSGNLQRQYVSGQTLLSDLNGGAGVSLGSFKITDSLGGQYTISLASNLTTVGEVIESINLAAPDHIEARINDTGDGIVIIDNGGGATALTIEDVSGSAAADLRLAGAAKTGENFIDGSSEITVEIDASMTLDDLVEELNAAGGAFTASVFNDGSAFNPYSLTLASNVTGSKGELVISTQGIDFGFDTLTQAQDALVTLGGDAAGGGMLLTSASNTLTDVVPGVTVDLLSASEEPVTLTVSQDVDAIVEAIQAFVDAYNAIHEGIDSYTTFDEETFARGVLFGDGTVNVIRNRLSNLVLRAYEGAPESYERLFSIGMTLGEGRVIEFDEEKFRDAYEANPNDVEALFTEDETGLGDVFEQTFDGLTDEVDGLIPHRDDLLEDKQELLNDRIEALQALLDAKRARLEAQFAALEVTLGTLQGQQTALGAISSGSTTAA